MFAHLAGKMPWEKVTIYQVDERVAPDGDPDRNLTHLRASLPPGGSADVRAMPVEATTSRQPRDYARSLPEALDLVHLGLGPDGHTASLVPGDPVLEVIDRDVAVTGEYQGRRRMTLTYPMLNRARRVLWLVTGEDKVDALRRLRAGDRSIPAGRVSSVNALVIADPTAVVDRPRGDERMTELEHPPAYPDAPEVLSVDVGGSHVKMLVNGGSERRRFVSGPEMSPAEMVKGVLEQTMDWEYGAVSAGVPAPVLGDRIVHEPVNLGGGWGASTSRPASAGPRAVLNDAAMQASGSLRRRANALPRARHRARVDDDRGRNHRADGARPPSLIAKETSSTTSGSAVASDLGRSAEEDRARRDRTPVR